MIFTNVSWIGDFILLWPVASSYHKKFGEKIHFVVSKNYYMYQIVDSFLRNQPFTKDISYVNVGSDAWNPANVNFNPAEFGIDGDYLNFGFWRQIKDNDYLPKYYAERYGLDVDYDYVPTLIEFDSVPIKKVTMEVAHQKDGYWPIWKKMMPDDVVELLSLDEPFEKNVWYSVKAEERHFGATSSAVLMDLFNLPTHIYGFPGLTPNLYYRNKFHTFHIP